MMGVSTIVSPNTNAIKTRRTTTLKNEKPRALKLSSSSSTSSDHNLEGVVSEMDQVSQWLQGGAWDPHVLYPTMTSLCENLKIYGPQLENIYKDQLDRCFISLRTGCRDDRLSLAVRYRLLEIIELRAMGWKPNQNLISYYQAKLQAIEAEEAAMEEQTEMSAYMTAPPLAMSSVSMTQTTPLQTPTTPTAPMYHPHHIQYGAYQPAVQQMMQQVVYPPVSAAQYHQLSAMDQYSLHHSQVVAAAQQIPQANVVPQPPMLSPGEVVRTSGKFKQPTRIAGKNYCKDEVVIRNQDSGKVMGIKGRRVHMIEELSETIISFQRVAPGARERLVQITGPTEENINQAKQLIEETIRRNASPVRETHSLSSGGSSVFSSSPLNGSNSSIASHTDDDTNSLNGCKRNTMVHSLSMGADANSVGGGSSCGGESCMSDYRYTVAHNSHAIRITGSNLSMVRTAKLVLDEYFNGERNLNNIAQLIGGDSTSSPPLLVKPATPPATPPPSSDGGEEVSVAPRGDESPKNGGVGIVRQPLFPSSSKEAIETAEKGSNHGNAGARNRRAAFAKTSEERNSNDEDAAGVYSRVEMASFANAPVSRLTPPTWGDIVQRVPELMKKGSQHLGAVQQILTEKGDSSMNSAVSYLQANDFYNASNIINWSPKWTNLHGSRSSPSTPEEETNRTF